MTQGAKAKRIARIPRPRVGDRSLQQFIDAVAETIEVREAGQRGDPLEATPTWRDLVQVGLAKLREHGITTPGAADAANPGSFIEAAPEQDRAIPASVQRLRAYGGFVIIVLEWQRVRGTSHSHVEVWRAAQNDIGKAVKIGDASGQMYTDAVGNGLTYYYWVRAVSRAGVTGPFQGASGVRARTALDSAYVLEVLEGQVTGDQLHQALREPLDQVLDQWTVKTTVGDLTGGIGLYNDGEKVTFGVLADRFWIGSPDGQNFPFILSEVDGQTVIALSADVLLNGSLSVANLRTGQLPGDAQILVGNGAVIIDGQGSIRISEPNDDGTSDYLFMSNGVLEMHKYLGGAHRLYKALSRRESGTVASGQTVNIPGWWSAQPEVQVSINTLASYDPDYPEQKQVWSVRAENLRETSEGRWAFDAVARLELGAASGTQPVNANFGPSSTNTWTSPAQETQNNTDAITVSMRLRSVRGTGTSPNYYYRRVRWRIGRATSENGTYTWSTYQTRNLGATLDAVTDTRSWSIPSGKWWIKVECIAEDAGGTFASGSTQYDYATDTRSDSSTVEAQAVGANASDFKNLDLGAYSTPSGWTITNIHYAYEYTWNVSGQSSGTRVEFNGVTGYQSGSDPSLADYKSIGFNSASTIYVSTALHCNAFSAFSGHFAVGRIRNGVATITRRRPAANTTTPRNEFTFQHFTYQLSTAQILAEGNVSWIAVGD